MLGSRYHCSLRSALEEGKESNDERNYQSKQGMLQKANCESVVLWPWSNLAFEAPVTKAYIDISVDMALHPDN